MDRMKELVAILNTAARSYYSDGASVMTDFDYDRLYDELVELEQRTGVVLSASPTRRVGYEVLSGLTKVRHEQPMLSLDKTKEPEKLAAFLAAGRAEGMLSWKLDGLTVALLYEGGELVQAATRGNGEIGEDITHNARVFQNLPVKIDYTGRLRVRGEAVITFADFERINLRLPPEAQYKNPRNLCSGTVRQLNSEVTASRSVNFFAFAVLDGNTERKSEGLKWLHSLGFDVVGYQLVSADTVEAAVEEMKRIVSGGPDGTTGNAYATDGLVLTYDSIAYSESLGATTKFPRDSIAFKWADELAETRLLEVQWGTSRTGLINPVAVFEPVELEGTTVNKASLHNVSVFEGLALGSGDLLTVYKANMIIPQVAENLTRSGTCRVPERCDVCGAQAEIVQANEGRALYCTNPNCRARLVSGLAHFASRDAMNIEGLSEATLEKFVACGFLNDYTDLYNLDQHLASIVALDGFGEKSAQNLMSAIERSKTVALPNFIYALGIDQVGLANAKLLCKYCGDMAGIRAAEEETLAEIPRFGEVIARSVFRYFHDPRQTALLDKVLPHLSFTAQEEQQRALDGLTFVITGELTQFRNRRELQLWIENAGGRVSGSVSGQTSYLINNDALSASAKNKKAAALGVPVITEEDFRQKFM